MNNPFNVKWMCLFLAVVAVVQLPLWGSTVYQDKCMSCHLDQAQGSDELKTPRLKGQFDWYLKMQMEAYQSGKRKGDCGVIKLNLSDSEQSAVAKYLSDLKSISTPQ